MRRLRLLPRLAVALSVVAAVLAGPGTALAAGRAVPVVGRAVPARAPEPPTTVCTVDDQRLREISGLVAVDGGYVAINDSAADASTTRIFFLDGRCRITRSVGYPRPARDPEDLAVAPDGSLWVADVGDNANASTHRTTIAVWRLAPGGKSPVVYRLTYPDGHHDAEAMLIDADGLPVIITKEMGGSARLYKPSAPLVAGTADGVPLAKVGSFNPKLTGTDNPFGFVGQNTVTGAAISADRRAVVLRTYADAYEFDAPDGNVVAAITGGSPRVTALPDEPQGEAITYSGDGAAYITVSDAEAAVPLLRYPRPGGAAQPSPNRRPGGSTAAPPPATGAAGTAGAGGASASAGRQVPAGQAGERTAATVAGGVVALLVLVVLVARRAGR